MVPLLTGCQFRTLLYVDADARLDSFQDSEGKQRSNLNLVASKYFFLKNCFRVVDPLSGNFDVISRPRTEAVPGEGEEGLVQ